MSDCMFVYCFQVNNILLQGDWLDSRSLLLTCIVASQYVSGSSKIQILLPSIKYEISPQNYEFLQPCGVTRIS